MIIGLFYGEMALERKRFLHFSEKKSKYFLENN